MDFYSWIDTKTAISILVGAVISVGTYWLGARKTRGAVQERIRAANGQLVDAVIKRIAVERQPMPEAHFRFLRSAKAREAIINENDIITFLEAKADVFAAVVSNDFLDASGKNAIIEVLDASTEAGPDETEPLPTAKARSIRYSLANSVAVLISGIAGLVGVFATLNFDEITPTTTERAGQPDWVGIVLLAVIAIFVGVRLISVLARPHKLEGDSADGGAAEKQPKL